jgi:hypothetical protein
MYPASLAAGDGAIGNTAPTSLLQCGEGAGTSDENIA